MVFEAEASGGSKAGGLPHPSLSPFPPLPLSIPPKFSDKPVGGKVRSSEGEVRRLPPYKYQPACDVGYVCANFNLSRPNLTWQHTSHIFDARLGNATN